MIARGHSIEGLNAGPGSPEAEIAEPAVVFREEVRRLLRKLEKKGYIAPVTSEEPTSLQTLKAWGPREWIPIDQVSTFFRGRLTEKGEHLIWQAAQEDDLDVETPSGFLNAVQQAMYKETKQEVRIGDEMERELLCLIPRQKSASAKRSSSLIEDQVANQVNVEVEDSAAGRVPLKAWLLNPRAAKNLLGAVAEQATVQANLKKEISETTRWLVEVAASDAKREALLTHIDELEVALGPRLEQFCQERGLSLPEEGSSKRMALLLRYNSELGALQTRESEIARRGEQLVSRQVAMQNEKASNQMLTQELPAVIESARKANVLREQLMAERIRHFLATLMVSGSSALVGSIGGLLAGVESTATTLVEKHPKVAISFAVGLATFVGQVVFHSGELSSRALQVFALRGALVSGITAVATGIGAGLMSSTTRREEI